MRLRFLRKCNCEDRGYVKLQQTETVDKVQYFEVTVNCRKCGKPWKEIMPKGPFDGKVLFTNANPKKKKTPREQAPGKDPKDDKEPKDPKKGKTSKEDKNSKKDKDQKKESLLSKIIPGVIFDKDRD